MYSVNLWVAYNVVAHYITYGVEGVVRRGMRLTAIDYTQWQQDVKGREKNLFGSTDWGREQTTCQWSTNCERDTIILTCAYGSVIIIILICIHMMSPNGVVSTPG